MYEEAERSQEDSAGQGSVGPGEQGEGLEGWLRRRIACVPDPQLVLEAQEITKSKNAAGDSPAAFLI